MNPIPKKEISLDGCEVLVFSEISNQEELDNLISQYPPILLGGSIVSNLQTGICTIPVKYFNCLGAIGEEVV